MNTIRRYAALATAIGAVTLTGCAGEQPAAPAASAGDVGRYCALVAELNGIGERVFADLSEDATPEEVTRREGMLVEQGAAQLSELERVAPAEIRADVPVFVADLRARASAPQGPDPAAAQAAEERILAFDEANCAGGADGS